MRILLTLLVIALSVPRICSASSPSEWKQYDVGEHGFSVALPSKPTAKALPTVPDESLTMYETAPPLHNQPKFSIFVGQPHLRGIFTAESKDSFLTSHFDSMVKLWDKGKTDWSRRTVFRDHAALEYQFSCEVSGVPYIGRGVIFIVDGGHMRLSMMHPNGDVAYEDEYNKFVGSFKLLPLAYIPSIRRFKESRGLTFSPPKIWVQKPAQGGTEVARYSNLTRSFSVLVAGNQNYRCSNYKSEVQASGRIKESSTINIGGQNFLKLTGFEDLPAYNVRLTTVFYCLDSRLGAVVLGAAEEELMFWRWEKVYEGLAGSLQVR